MSRPQSESHLVSSQVEWKIISETTSQVLVGDMSVFDCFWWYNPDFSVSFSRLTWLLAFSGCLTLSYLRLHVGRPADWTKMISGTHCKRGLILEARVAVNFGKPKLDGLHMTTTKFSVFQGLTFHPISSHDKAPHCGSSWKSLRIRILCSEMLRRCAMTTTLRKVGDPSQAYDHPPTDV